jgi:sortase (surface protein transpeptidase)
VHAHAHRASAGDRRHPWRRLTLLLAALAFGSGVAGWVRLDESSHRMSATEPQLRSIAAEVVPRSEPRVFPRPTELQIPAIGVATSLVALGLNADGTVEVPTDPNRAGWYDRGPAPGEPGSAVILGHVDSTSGRAVFYRLVTLTPGASITIARSDGTVVRFVVRNVTTYANDHFPAAAVYRDRGTTTLTLVTCGGTYDEARGGYQANVVVSAAYLGPVRAPAPTRGPSS